jgi:hypothetical protein
MVAMSLFTTIIQVANDCFVSLFTTIIQVANGCYVSIYYHYPGGQ